MIKRIIAGILSAAIVFSTLSPAVSATEYVTDEQEIVEEMSEEIEIQELLAEEVPEETEVQELPEEEISEEMIGQELFVAEVLEETNVQELQVTEAIEENRTIQKEGTYGENLTWILYEDGELVINGSGEISDYKSSIGEYSWGSFSSSVKSVVLSEGITYVGIHAFSSFSNLEKLVIPSSMQSLGNNAFSYCDKLTEIIYDGTWEEWKTIKDASSTSTGLREQYLFVDYSFQYRLNEDGSITITGPGEGNIGGNVKIPETIDGATVTVIGANAFLNSKGIAALEIPGTVKVIEEKAFYDGELRLIKFHEGLERIGDYAFYSALGSGSPNYYTVGNVSLPEGLESIGKYAFADADVTKITVPASVKAIGTAAFNGSETILFKGSAQQWIDVHDADTSKYPPRSYVTYEGDGCGFIKESQSDSYRIFCWKGVSGDVVVPSEFRGLPVTGIDSYVFSGNQNIKSVVIPESVTWLSDSLFYECKNLESVEIKAPISYLSYQLFYNCTSLKTVKLPFSITEIDSYAFYQCIGLENIYYDSSYNWKNMDIDYGNEILDAAEIHFVNDWGYEVITNNQEKQIRIIGKTEVTEELEIPSEFYGVPVKQIGYDSWDDITGIFQGNETIQKVVIPNSVESIYKNTFKGCKNLKTVDLPETLKYIGNNAFAGCVSLQNVSIPKDTEVEDDAFTGCSGLAGSDQSDVAIKYMGFFGENLTWVLYENGHLVIRGEGKMPEEFTSYSDYPWYSYKSLITKITISEGITSIGKYAFYNYDELEEIKFPESLVSIESCAFYYSDKLEEVEFPENLVSIGEYAFEDCDNLKQVTIPKSVTTIGKEAFSDCYKLCNITYEGTWDDWKSINGGANTFTGLYDQYITADYSFKYRKNEDGTITITGAGEGGIGGIVQIPETIDEFTVSAIGSSAFANNKGIKVIDIPSTVKTIQEKAFYDGEIRKITLHEGLQSVGNYAFYSAIGRNESSSYEMEELILPEGLESIGKYAFAEAYVETITIPASVKTIGTAAFHSYENILFKGSAQDWIDAYDADTSKYPPRSYVTYEGDGCGFIKKIKEDESVSYVLFSWTDASGDVVVPSEFRGAPVTTIDEFAFRDNLNIKSVEIPESVSYIDSNTFFGCKNLESVKISGSIDCVESNLFYNCTSLKTVYLPHTIERIYSDAFYQCISLSDIYYESSYNWKKLDVSSGNEALEDAELHSEHDWGYEIYHYESGYEICITGKSTTSEELIIPSEFHGIPVTYVGKDKWDITTGIFEGNETIQKVEIPDGIEYIGDNAFKGCKNLKEINLPDNLKEVGTYAFKECSSLKLIKIPKRAELNVHAFEGCTALEKIEFHPEYDGGFACHLFAGCTGVKEIIMANNTFSVWYGSDSCEMDSRNERVESVFEGVPRTAKVYVAQDSGPYYEMVELGFTNLSVAITLRELRLPLTVSVELGKTKSVSVKKVPATANDPLNLVWTSSDESIVSVDANGVITGNQLGTAQITVKDINSGMTARTMVSVVVPATAILTVEMDPEIESLGLQTGQSATMMIMTSQYGRLSPDLFTFTSSDDSIATVDESGVITSIYDGKNAISVKITAKLNNDPLERKVSVSVKNMAIQTKEIVLYAPEEEITDGVMVISKQKVKDGNYEIQLVAQGIDQNGEASMASFTWQSSDKKIATVDANGKVDIKKNADGVATITATANDLSKVQKSVVIDVQDYTPRLSTNTITLNTNSYEEAQIEVFSTYDSKILNTRLEGDDRFYATYKNDEAGKRLIIGANEVVAKGTYKLNVVTEIEDRGEHSQIVTVKVANKVPAITVKQAGAFNLFYTDSTANVSVVAKDAVVSSVELTETETFQSSFDKESGILQLSFADRDALLDKKAVLEIELENYREPVTKVFNISAKEVKPVLSVSRKNTKLSTLSMNGAPLQIINGATKEPINWETCFVDVVETSSEHVLVTYQGTDLTILPIVDENGKFVDGKTSHTAKLEVLGENWSKPILVSHVLSISTAMPTIKPQNAVLTLNGLFGNLAETVLVPGVLNCPEPTDYLIEAVAVNENTEKILVEADGWNLTARFVNEDDLPANGNYKYRVQMFLPGYDAEAAITTTITVKVVSTIPKVTADKKVISLNKTLTDQAKVSLTAINGFDVTNVDVENVTGNPLTSEQIEFTFDALTNKMNVKVLDSQIAAGTYKYLLKPVVTMGTVTKEVAVKEIPFSVKIHEGIPTLKVSASGSLDLVNREQGITYTLIGGVNFNYDAAKVLESQIGLTGADADRFVVESIGLNAKGQPQILVKPKQDAAFFTTETCKMKLNVKMEDLQESIQTADLNIKPKQSALKMEISGNTTVYKSVGYGKIAMKVVKPENAKIEMIQILNTKATTVPDGAITFELVEEQGIYYLKYQIQDGSKLKTGAGYKLSFGVTPKGNAANKAAQTVSISLKVQR